MPDVPANCHQDADAKPTILLVEDELLVRWMLAEEFRNAGFQVIEAANSEEALSVLRTSVPVGLLMTDVFMPGEMDGVALARWARNARPELKIVIGSAFSRSSVPERMADLVVMKPYDVEAMLRDVRALLGNR